MKKILVPTDFSACANNAVDFAVHVANEIDAEISLLHSFEIKDNMYTDYMGVNRYYNQTILDDSYELIKKMKKKIESKTPVKVDIMVKTSSVQASIENAIEEINADLVIMGATGIKGIHERLWGSSTSEFISTCQTPVIAVPLIYKWKKPGKFVLATNQFDLPEETYDFIYELADLMMAQVRLVVFTDVEKEKAQAYIEAEKKIPFLKDQLQQRYNLNRVLVDHIHGTSFNESMQEYIAEQEVDLLVMITHKRKFLESFIHPSKTKKMTSLTRVPLLAIPAVKNEAVY